MKTECDINIVWEKYQRNKSGKYSKRYINQLVEFYYPYVNQIANRLARRLTSAITADELASYGIEGLYKAIENFEPSRKIKFITYAYRRIQGSMLDGLRQDDWVPRSVRARQAQIEKETHLMEAALGHHATAEDVLSVLGIDDKKFSKSIDKFKAKSMVSIDNCVDHNIDSENNKKDFNAYLVSTSDIRPDSKLIRKEFLNKLIGKRCSSLERKIVYLYYYEGLTMKEITETLQKSNIKISESRISQIHQKMMDKLHENIAVNPDYFSDILDTIDSCSDYDSLF